MNDESGHAHEAYVVGALLALGIQKMRMLTSDEHRDVRACLRGSLRKIGVDPNIMELDKLKLLDPDQAVNAVIDLKANLETAIAKNCGDFTSGLFLLTFDFMLVSTDAENVPNFESSLQPRAVGLGFDAAIFAAILARLRATPDEAVAEYQKAAEGLIAKQTAPPHGKLLDAVELKPGIVGFEVDLKQLWSQVKHHLLRRRGG